MAAPDDKNVKNLAGVWEMNKKLSDDPDPVLALQGVSWLLRKAIGLARVTLYVKQYSDESNVPHVDIATHLTAGVKGTEELRTLDWQYRDHTDYIFGTVKGRSRYTTLAEVSAERSLDAEDREFLAKEWVPDIMSGGPVIEAYVESESGWTARQVWGFEFVAVDDGAKQKRFSRRTIVKSGPQVKRISLIYDWTSPLP